VPSASSSDSASMRANSTLARPRFGSTAARAARDHLARDVDADDAARRTDGGGGGERDRPVPQATSRSGRRRARRDACQPASPAFASWLCQSRS
jgi:hypothetical protein